jgi:Cu(I)/Ag(I) efflux system membrane protein CusA/SilA
MPTTLPGISVGEATRLLETQDRIIKSFPEVDRVFGKAGRVDSATDPAPYTMMETVIVLKPQDEWPKQDRWWSKSAPDWSAKILRRFWPDHKSTQQLIYGPGGLNEALTFPGVANAWTMPIKARIDMLSTGIRTPVGLKIAGGNLEAIEEIGAQIERLLPQVSGTRSVFAERTGSGFFIDIEWNREALSRYGLSIAEAQLVGTYEKSKSG